MLDLSTLRALAQKPATDSARVRLALADIEAALVAGQSYAAIAEALGVKSSSFPVLLMRARRWATKRPQPTGAALAPAATGRPVVPTSPSSAPAPARGLRVIPAPVTRPADKPLDPDSTNAREELL
jgi:hypothetical protein